MFHEPLCLISLIFLMLQKEKPILPYIYAAKKKSTWGKKMEGEREKKEEILFEALCSENTKA